MHRRSRALSRLRKLLLESEDTDDNKISAQSLTNILLPIALHPVYECTKGEEGYALEAVATVGVICKNLPWGKYQNALWNALVQLPRHESQERYLVATICSIIDSFHFEVSIVEDTTVAMDIDDSPKDDRNFLIWKQLRDRFIPKIESYLMKEITTRDGSKDKILRSPIALALTKLLQKLPHVVFEKRFPQLLTIVCNTLKNRDSDTREVARKTLAKIAATVDIKYLADIVRELAIALNEGYKLFVRTATLHSVLLAISDKYQRPNDQETLSTILPFDSCVPAMMDIIQQDIFGTTSQMKEAEGAKKRLVKEAGGAKSYSSLELISRMILFKPSLFAKSGSFSGVHALVNPFLERLRDPEVTSSTIGKVRECMGKIVFGISNNSSSVSEEMLPFVYATVAPFIITSESSYDDHDDEDDNTDEEVMKGLEVSRSRPKREKKSEVKVKKGTRKVFDWAPSQLKAAKDSRSAYEMKMKEKVELRKVQDGVNAPKMTGSSRYDSLKSKSDINSPAISCAVSFGLSLLHAHLKRNKSNGSEEMSDPFVKILAYCVQQSKDNDAVLLSLKCLQVLLYLDLPSVPIYRKDLARSILRILSSLSCNTQNEMVQGCFKTLTLLLAIDRKAGIKFLSDNEVDTIGISSSNETKIDPILSKSQMQVLMSILQSALTDAEHYNATFGIIKAITSRKYVSPEYYDLMDTILKMTVQSQMQTMRQQASKIFMQYLIEYPMGKPRLETHLKQIVLNIKYEYDDGRISALGLLNAIINKLPLPLLEEYTQLFFLPLVLQLVNDESKKCRESVGMSISTLLSRLSKKVLQSLYEYATRWSEDPQGGQLHRMSAQLFGLFVDARIDFMKKNDRLQNLVTYLRVLMQKEIGQSDHTSVLLAREWEIMYFCLQTIEKIGHVQQTMLWKDTEVWESIIKSLVHPHPWVQLLASRIVYTNFAPCKLEDFSTVSESIASSIILKIPGSLFEIARNLCFQLNSEEDQQAENVSTMAIKNLSWIIKVMHVYPNLCYKDGENEKLDTDTDGIEGGDEKNTQKHNPATWLITRLSNIAKKHGNIRREAIFKCFAAFATVCDADFVTDHLEFILGPLDRVIVETEYLERSMANKFSGRRSTPTPDVGSVATLPKEIMHLLEDKCGTEEFMRALTSVKSHARDKRMVRKQRDAAEKVNDPESAAKRKLARQEMKKNRKKRKTEERMRSRGSISTKKSRHKS